MHIYRIRPVLLGDLVFMREFIFRYGRTGLFFRLSFFSGCVSTGFDLRYVVFSDYEMLRVLLLSCFLFILLYLSRSAYCHYSIFPGVMFLCSKLLSYVTKQGGWNTKTELEENYFTNGNHPMIFFIVPPPNCGLISMFTLLNSCFFSY